MFTQTEKMFIADHVQELLKSMHNPDLPEDKNIAFHLHINGIDSWSFCDINSNRDLPKLEAPTRKRPDMITTYSNTWGKV